MAQVAEEGDALSPTELEAEAAEEKSRNEWILGLFFIFLVSVLWAAGSIIVQFVADDIGYNQPFVFTFIGSGVMTLFVPSYLGLSLVGLAYNPPFRDETGREGRDGELVYKSLHDEASENDVGCDAAADRLANAGRQEQQGAIRRLEEEAPENGLLSTAAAFANGSRRRGREVSIVSGVVVGGSTPVGNPMRSHLFMFKIGLSLSVVWYFTQWGYATSLAYTSVSSSTIISNSSSLFVYLFNVAARTERFTKTKTVGVLLALSGAVLVSLGDREADGASKESLWGDASALAAAVGYGVYSTILTAKSPSDGEVSMSLVLGYMGIVNVLIFLPMLVCLALVPGVRILHGLSLRVVQLIALRAVMDNLFSELLWARATLLTTPTVATVGCAMTIPIAFVSDFVLHGKVPHTLAVSGAVAIVTGFYFVSARGGGGGGGRCRHFGGGGVSAAARLVRRRLLCCRGCRWRKLDER